MNTLYMQLEWGRWTSETKFNFFKCDSLIDTKENNGIRAYWGILV